MDDTEVGDLNETRSLILAALVHQSRQPLFVLQNYLFAVGQLAARSPDSQSGEEIQVCVTEMRSAVEGLRQCLARISVMGADGESSLSPRSLAGFLEETFQIVRYCARRHNVQIHWEIQAIPPDAFVNDPAGLQLRMVQWILDACPDDAADATADQDAVLKLTARHSSNGSTIALRRAALELEFEISSVTTRANSVTAPLST